MTSERTRTTWTSATARAAWQERIQTATAAWADLELLSVSHGLRQAALVYGRHQADRLGLPVLAVSPNRFAVGPEAKALAYAFKGNRDAAVGEILGFPACCQKFFEQTWAKGTMDTTWEMADRLDDRTRSADGSPLCTMMGRPLGMRWVTHLPCSVNCQESIGIGAAMRHLMQGVNREAADTIDEVLQWPVEWSALHGISEVKYPVAKVVGRYAYTPSKITVRRQGSRYPAEGARGLSFPFRLDAAMPQPMTFRKSEHAENGFASKEAMDRAHAMVIDGLRGSPPKGVVFDLGCGNGTLMNRVRDAFSVKVYGVEKDASKTHGDERITVADLLMFMDLPPADTFLVSERRFEEIPSLRRRCIDKSRQVLVYSYDEPQFARFL